MAMKVETERVIGESRVFVYGSLKRGWGNNRLLADQKFLGRHVLIGSWKAINLGYFPGVVFDIENKAGTAKVLGEVYSVSPQVLAALDMLEGHPRFYQRVRVQTPWKNAWIYVLPQDYLAEPDGYPQVQVVEGVQVWNPKDEEREFIRDYNRACPF